MLAPLAPEIPKRDRIRTIAVEAANKGDPGPAVQKRVEFAFQGSPALRQAIERAKDLGP